MIPINIVKVSFVQGGEEREQEFEVFDRYEEDGKVWWDASPKQGMTVPLAFLHADGTATVVVAEDDRWDTWESFQGSWVQL